MDCARSSVFVGLALLWLLFCTPVAGAQLAGLIRTGLDTLDVPKEAGFDFVSEGPCSTRGSWDQNCAAHFEVSPQTVPERFTLTVRRGYGIQMGKMDLDSIKDAPSDSTFKANHYMLVDSLFPDSLSSYIGNVYVIKTGSDPGRGYPLIGKLKILDIIVQNAAEHRIDMVFLWAVNFSGLRDLATTNLDTFDLDSGAVGIRPLATGHAPRVKAESGTKKVLIGSRMGISRSGMLFDVAGRAIPGERMGLKGRGGAVARRRAVRRKDRR